MSATAKRNRDAWVAVVAQYRDSVAQVQAGGGPQAVQRQHQKNRLTARERIAALIDPGTTLQELFTFAGWEMYADWGGAPCGGVVAGLARVGGRDWMVVANDATVKAGAFFPITAKKVIRAQTMALENHLPVIYLVDSAGVFLPLQDEVFPDQDDFGRIFYLNARLSALGVPQISAIMGHCVAGGAYLPVMTDVVLMTQGSGLYLAGPALVKAAIGQEIDSESLGGAAMHAQVAGTIDFHEPDEAHCLERIRVLAGLYAQPRQAPWAQARRPSALPADQAPDAYGVVSPDGQAPYDVRQLIAGLVDGSQWVEYRADYGQTVICGYAHLGGFPVGLVANQRKTVRRRTRGAERVEVGGVIYAEAADKAARFILEVNQRFIPLLFLQDVTGFMVGSESEQNGIIRRGAKLVNAVANSVVPKISLIVGGSFGAGNYAMAGRAYSPRFYFAWPSARYAVMSGASAARTLLEVEVNKLERQGLTPTDEDLHALYQAIRGRYNETLDPRYAAARLWVDEIILPHQTRDRLIGALEVCALNPHQPPLQVGVFQV